MFRLLCPRWQVNSLFEIELDKLHEIGIKGVIFDLDNTIIPWNAHTMPTKIISRLRTFQAEGFRICLLSNNMGQRVSDIAAIFSVPFVSPAYKPSKTGFRRAVAALGLTEREVAVVGDQLFTDILGGNRLGLFTIWVSPLSSDEFIGTKITRKLEKITARILRVKGLIK